MEVLLNCRYYISMHFASIMESGLGILRVVTISYDFRDTNRTIPGHKQNDSGTQTERLINYLNT